MKRKRTSALFAGGFAIFSSVASADDTVPARCTITVPNGSAVNAATGDVTLNGVLIEQHPDCTATLGGGGSVAPDTCSGIGVICGSPSSCCGGLDCNDYFGTCEQSFLNAAQTSATLGTGFGGGPAAINSMLVTWTVPGYPANGVDSELNSFWPALKMEGISNAQLMQPVVHYVQGSSSYHILSEVFITGGVDYQTSGLDASPDDTIEGTLQLLGYEPTMYGEYWEIITHDVTNGNQTTLDWYTGTGWPHFTHAIMAAYEVHALYACDGLSDWGGAQFQLGYLTAWDPSWDTSADATSVMSWVAFAAPTTQAPYCNWGAALAKVDGSRYDNYSGLAWSY